MLFGRRGADLGWFPDGDILVMASDDRGSSTLRRIDVWRGDGAVIAEDLDADPVSSPFAVSPDGRRACWSLRT